jgi:hypothetical protein
MSSSPSLSLSDDSTKGKVRASVEIDLCSPKRPRQEEPPAAAPLVPAIVDMDIDPSKFFVPLSKQGFGVLHRQADAASRSVVVAPPPLTQSKGKWKKKGSFKKGKAASVPKKPREKKATTKKASRAKKVEEEVDEEDEEDEVEEEEEVEKVEKPARSAASFFRPAGSNAAPSGGAAVAALASSQLELPKNARDYFSFFKMREVDQLEPGASQKEKDDIVTGLWESLSNLERAVYDKLAELDSRRYAAELKVLK